LQSIDVQLNYLVLGSCLLSEGKDGGDADSQVETTDVEELGLLHERPDVGLLQVLKLVLVGSSEMSAHAAVVASDDDTALAGGLGLVDTVLSVDAGLLAGLLQDITILVLADTANVDNRVVGKKVLYRLLVYLIDKRNMNLT
jgi:hypothetical protein